VSNHTSGDNTIAPAPDQSNLPVFGAILSPSDCGAFSTPPPSDYTTDVMARLRAADAAKIVESPPAARAYPAPSAPITPAAPSQSEMGEIWAARADELVAWTLKHLVVRDDICGQYIRGADGAVSQITVRDVDDLPERLHSHYRAKGTDDIVGLHTTAWRE
jgi:hypothetical protein